MSWDSKGRPTFTEIVAEVEAMLDRTSSGSNHAKA